MEAAFFQNEGFFSAAIIIAALWVLPWKGYALWLSARNKQKWWFIILLIVNTLAILDIIYIFFIGRKKQKERRSSDVHEEKIST